MGLYQKGRAMDLREIKTKIEAKRVKLKEDAGKPLFSSEHGPIGLELITDLVTLIEQLTKRVDALEKKPGTTA